MISHYTSMALKAFLKFKLHSLINLVSLVFGFVCFISSTLVSNYINSFDMHFPDSENTYTLVRTNQSASGDGQIAYVSEPVARYLRSEFPEIEHIVRATPAQSVNATIEGQTDTFNARYVESGFIDIFPIEILTGIETGENLPPGTALISEAAAIRRFGTTDVIGKNLLLEQLVDVTIVGVTKTFERPSHIESAISSLSSDLIIPIEVFDQMLDLQAESSSRSNQGDNWESIIYYTYIQFPSNTDVDEIAFQTKLDRFAEQFVPKRIDSTITYSLQPINGLATSTIELLFGGIDITIALVLTGGLVLLIACLNYTNLVIAQLSLRSQEIGVQKILGAKRSQLITQYSYESSLFIAFSLAITLVVLFLILISLGNSGVVGVNSSLLLKPALWTNLGIVCVIIVAISGAYPALRTASVSLVTLMRPKGSEGYSSRLRSIMVGTQFTISGTLIIMSFVMFNQNRVMSEQLDGNNTDPKVVLTTPLGTLPIDPDLFATELNQHPAILSVTKTGSLPWSIGISDMKISRSADFNAAKIDLVDHTVGYDFSDTLDIPLLAGRTFSRDRANDILPSVDALRPALGPFSLIIDDKAAEQLGWGNPEDAIGQSVYRHYGPPSVPTPFVLEQIVVGVAGEQRFTIVNYGTFGMGGTAYNLQPDNARYLIIRISRQDVAGALQHIDQVWNRLLPELIIKRQFVDELFYEAYQIFNGISAAVAGLSILGFIIASVGLLGNATFITNIRQREVGIRKVMGASPSRLMRMLLLDFSKPVIIANIFAWPIGYVLASGYISLFSTQASLSAVPFIGCLVISVLITCLAVVSQSWKSVSVKPASVLRYE